MEFDCLCPFAKSKKNVLGRNKILDSFLEGFCQARVEHIHSYHGQENSFLHSYFNTLRLSVIEM